MRNWCPCLFYVFVRKQLSPFGRSWLEALITKPDADGKSMHVLLMCMHMHKLMTDVITRQRCEAK